MKALLFFLLSSSVYGFGISGYHGQNGYDGRDGISGKKTTLFINHEGASIDLSGTDGEEGNPGRPGGDASGCFHGRPNHNLYGADGGHGGNGGDGGRGGDSGTLDLYYKDLLHIKNTYVDMTPGRGGRGARGSFGGRGCHCRFYSWSKVIQNPDGSTRRLSFRCFDGNDGRDGYWGSEGSDGSVGKISLIQKDKPLEEVYPILTTTLGELQNKQHLSRHVWEQKSGARLLFHNASKIPDQYLNWIETEKKTVSLKWKSHRFPLSDFSKTPVKVELSDSLHFIADPSLWLKTMVKRSRNHDTIIIQDAFTEEMVSKIIPVSLEGYEEKIVLTLKDEFGLLDAVNDRFYLDTKWSRTDGQGDGLLKRFKDFIPPEVIAKIDPHTYEIHLGKLPVKMKYFKKRRTIKFDLTLIRSFENFQKKVGRFDTSRSPFNENFKVKIKDIDL